MRHGQTTGDVEDRYGGNYNDHLTELGFGQAQELSKKLEGRNIQIIFHSPLIRARETAEILHDKLNIEIKQIENLRERNAYGALTGMVKAEAKEKYPKQVEILQDPHNTVTGAEEYQIFKTRILGSIEELANRNFDTIGILTHGGPIYCFFREVIDQGELKQMGDCVIIELEYNNGAYQLIDMDGVSF